VLCHQGGSFLYCHVRMTEDHPTFHTMLIQYCLSIYHLTPSIR
jgi:hypothetical protein